MGALIPLVKDTFRGMCIVLPTDCSGAPEEIFPGDEDDDEHDSEWLFTPGSELNTHKKAVQTVSDWYHAFIDEMAEAICDSWNDWTDSAKLNGIIVNAGVGILPPSCLTGSSDMSKSSILDKMELDDASDTYNAYAEAIAEGLATAWAAWVLGYSHMAIPFPGAAVIGPVPPTPCVPIPLLLGVSPGDALLIPIALSASMEGICGDSQHADRLFLAFSTGISTIFAEWKGATMVVDAKAAGGIGIPAMGAVGTGGTLKGPGVTASADGICGVDDEAEADVDDGEGDGSELSPWDVLGLLIEGFGFMGAQFLAAMNWTSSPPSTGQLTSATAQQGDFSSADTSAWADSADDNGPLQIRRVSGPRSANLACVPIVYEAGIWSRQPEGREKESVQWKIINQDNGSELDLQDFDAENQPGYLTLNKLPSSLIGKRIEVHAFLDNQNDGAFALTLIEEEGCQRKELAPEEPIWITIARKEIGQADDTAPGESNPRVLEYRSTTAKNPTSDEVAWCSSFAKWVIKQSGLHPDANAMARSWENWKGSTQIDQPAYGAIVTFWRDSPTSGSGHVAFVVGQNSDGTLLVLGGNQLHSEYGYSVNISPWETKYVTGYWYPISDHELSDLYFNLNSEGTEPT